MGADLAKHSRNTGTSSGAKTRPQITYGELVADAVIDVVASKDPDGLDVLSWDGRKLFTAPRLDYRGVVYCAPDLDPSIRRAIRFPNGATDYGSATKLFTNIANLYREHLGLAEDLAAFTTCWNLATWIPELMLMPVTMCVTATKFQVLNLFRMFHSLCRRPLMVAELSRRLPIFLHPTLLVDDPKLSPKACSFWRAASVPGVIVPVTESRVCELACSKAVRLQPEDSLDAWGEEAMHLVLPPTEFPPLSDHLLASIAAEFQPQLEMHRLRRLSGKEKSAFPSSPLSKFQLARDLFACLPEDAGIVRTLTPLLESHQQELLARGSRNPQVAIVKAVWVPAHEPGKMSVSDVAKRANTILRSDEEMYLYSPREVGWLLRKMRLQTHRTPNCKVLQFSSEIRQRVHELARNLGLQLPAVQGCPACKELEVVDKYPVV
jgi:hypothetical protein